MANKDKTDKAFLGEFPGNLLSSCETGQI